MIEERESMSGAEKILVRLYNRRFTLLYSRYQMGQKFCNSCGAKAELDHDIPREEPHSPSCPIGQLCLQVQEYDR